MMQLCSGCNGRLAALSSEVSVRFIVLPMEFDGSQGPVYGKKSGSIEMRNSAAWGVAGAINVMQLCAGCTGDMP